MVDLQTGRKGRVYDETYTPKGNSCGMVDLRTIRKLLIYGYKETRTFLGLKKYFPV